VCRVLWSRIFRRALDCGHNRCQSGRVTHATTEPVTCLFTDVEGATTLWEDHADVIEAALTRHDALLRSGANAWSDWWASKALDWVDQGVWSDGVADALRRCSVDRLYSQETRHRAWRYIKPRS
jgi:hypothetical protein